MKKGGEDIWETEEKKKTQVLKIGWIGTDYVETMQHIGTGGQQNMGIENKELRIGKMAQQIKNMFCLAEDCSSVPSIHMTTHNQL